MMEMDYATLATVVTLLLTLAASVFGVKYTQKKLKKVRKLFGDIVEAAKDDKVSEKEFQKIVNGAVAIVDSKES